MLISLLLLPMSGCGGADQRVTLERPTSPIWCPSGLVLNGERREHGSFDARQVIGMSTAQAQDTAHRHGCELRVTSIDGTAQRLALIAGRRFIDVKVQHGVVARFDYRFGPIG
jgi:hypothetical protein